MLSYRLGTVNYFHWEFKPDLSYRKPNTLSTSFGEGKERNSAFNLSNQAKPSNFECVLLAAVKLLTINYFKSKAGGEQRNIVIVTFYGK